MPIIFRISIRFDFYFKLKNVQNKCKQQHFFYTFALILIKAMERFNFALIDILSKRPAIED